LPTRSVCRVFLVLQYAQMDTLLAEIARLQELVAVKDQLLTSKDQLLMTSQDHLLSSREAQLAMKDELLAAKDQLIASKEKLVYTATEQLQQYQGSDQQCDSAKRQRLHDSSSLEGASPLDKDEVLDQILSYVGGGDHFYVAGVNRRWRGKYLQYCVQSSTSEHDKKLVTRHRSGLMSESRLLAALGSGLSVSAWRLSKLSYAEAFCNYSAEPELVITLLRLHGVPWAEMLCIHAALHGKLQLLQWLRSRSCPWDECTVALNAGRGGSVPMLQWLATVTKPWSEGTVADMLTAAASCGKLAAAQWLKGRGAAWPTAFASQFRIQANTAVSQCWSASTVQWALASGSGWLDWKCEDYAADRYRKQHRRAQATELLEWAHANGCPCTCGHVQQQQQ
jgi:hypothetical protein